jgi:hypothetical protein
MKTQRPIDELLGYLRPPTTNGEASPEDDYPGDHIHGDIAGGSPAASPTRRQRQGPPLRCHGPAAEPGVLDEPPWPEPPDEAAFHGLAGAMARAFEPFSEADPVALLAQMLVAFGNATGRGAYFRVEGDTHRCNEFLALVGRSSKARKGVSWGPPRRVVESIDEEYARDRIKGGLSSGEGVIWAVHDAVSTRHPVKERGRITGYEEVESDPGVSDKRLLCVEPELASVLKRMDQQGNSLSAVLRLAWDGLDLQTLTKSSPARATGPHVSVVGHITAEELRRYLSATESANGFGNRFLWLCVQRSKALPFGGSPPATLVAGLERRFRAALDHARAAGEMGLDDDARGCWAAVYEGLSDGKPGLAGALLSRGEAHVRRLAMIYALLDCAPAVGEPHLRAALALWEYAEASVRFIFGTDTGDPLADDILRSLRASPNGLTRAEINNLLGRNQSAAAIGKALALLQQHRLAHCRQDRSTGGRPAERWFHGPAGEAA